MGFWRSLYGVFNWEYIGTKEQKEIEKQRGRRHLVLEGVKAFHNGKNLGTRFAKPLRASRFSLSLPPPPRSAPLPVPKKKPRSQWSNANHSFLKQSSSSARSTFPIAQFPSCSEVSYPDTPEPVF